MKLGFFILFYPLRGLFMKKLLIISSLALSMSYMSSSYAVDPVTAGVAAGAAEVAVESAAIAAGAGGAAKAAVLVGAASAATAVGTTAVGIGAGYGTAKLMNDQLFTEGCEGKEEACKNAKIGTYTGATLGTLGVLSAVAMEGISTAGLATIGSAIGGGAIAGAATLVAAPIIAAAAVGGATYWWFARDTNNADEPAADNTSASQPE
jgi:hypothetical protein